MGKLIVSEFITLDGVMEAPGGEPTHPHSGWVFDFMGPEQEQYKLAEVQEADAHLLGRVTYESFAGAWPERQGPFAEKINSMPKYVVSSTLSEPLEWENSSLLRGRGRRVGRRAEAAPRRAPPGGRQRDPGALPARGRPGRRAAADGLPGDRRRRQAARSRSRDSEQAFSLTDSRSFDSGVAVHTYEPA